MNTKPRRYPRLEWITLEICHQPTGLFRLLEGAEYSDARSAANATNLAMHAADSSLDGMQIHEIQPVEYRGSQLTGHALLNSW
jgi:hypothetical protein